MSSPVVATNKHKVFYITPARCQSLFHTHALLLLWQSLCIFHSIQVTHLCSLLHNLADNTANYFSHMYMHVSRHFVSTMPCVYRGIVRHWTQPAAAGRISVLLMIDAETTTRWVGVQTPRCPTAAFCGLSTVRSRVYSCVEALKRTRVSSSTGFILRECVTTTYPSGGDCKLPTNLLALFGSPAATSSGVHYGASAICVGVPNQRLSRPDAATYKVSEVLHSPS